MQSVIDELQVVRDDDGLSVDIPIAVCNAYEVIVLDQLRDVAGSDYVESLRVAVPDGAHVTLLEGCGRRASAPNRRSMTIQVGRNAWCRLVSLNVGESHQVASVQLIASDGSEVHAIDLQVGSGDIRKRWAVEQKGSGAQVRIEGLVAISRGKHAAISIEGALSECDPGFKVATFGRGEARVQGAHVENLIFSSEMARDFVKMSQTFGMPPATARSLLLEASIRDMVKAAPMEYAVEIRDSIRQHAEAFEIQRGLV